MRRADLDVVGDTVLLLVVGGFLESNGGDPVAVVTAVVAVLLLLEVEVGEGNGEEGYDMDTVMGIAMLYNDGFGDDAVTLLLLLLTL